jgi:recombinational DNA repair ATPase RecF
MAKKTAKRIERLVLRGFRGATAEVPIDFDTTKPIVMIFGENGTGKSTIVDALDFVCNEKFGSLSERSSTKPQKHLVALGGKVSDLSIEMICARQTWTGRLVKRKGGDSPKTDGPEGRPIARILRRSSVLRLIESPPNERYKEIQEFIDLPQIEKAERDVSKAYDELEDKLNATTQSIRDAEELLQRICAEEGGPEHDYMMWAEEAARNDASHLELSIKGLESLLQKLGAAQLAQTYLTDAAGAHESELERQRLAEAELAVFEQKEGLGKSALLDLLRQAKSFLDFAPQTTECPLCAQPIEAPTLKEKIEAHLTANDAFIKLSQSTGSAKRGVERAAGLLSQRRREFISNVQQLVRPLEEGTDDNIKDVQIDWGKYKNLVDNTQMIALADASSSQSLDEALELLREVETYRSELGLDDHLIDLRQRLGQLKSVRINWEAAQEKRKQAEEYDRQVKALKEIRDTITFHRKKYIDDTLQEISKTVEELYAKLHPEEGFGNVRFFLKQNVARSMEFDGSFQGQSELPPGAYYSESHLDTLGVCIFLALARYYNDPNTVVVLDDVVTSVDDVHMERFIRMLHEEAEHFSQIVITTHYRGWRDRYKFGQSPSGAVHLLELLSWSHSKGVRHSKTKLVIDDLRHWVQQEPLERQVVASKSGILLEGLLDQLALRYRCKLPRQPEPHYTLGDLIGAFEKELRKKLRVEKFNAKTTEGEELLTRFKKNNATEADLKDDHVKKDSVDLHAVLNEIAGMSWIRNQVGCHFNTAGMAVSDAEVLKLGEKTIELTAAIVCDNCGELPSSNKSGSYWNCSCKRTRLWPLVHGAVTQAAVSE